MMSWYYAGYYTGLHEGQQQSADKAAWQSRRHIHGGSSFCLDRIRYFWRYWRSVALCEPEIKISGPGSTNRVRVHQVQGSGFMNKTRAGKFRNFPSKACWREPATQGYRGHVDTIQFDVFVAFNSYICRVRHRATVKWPRLALWLLKRYWDEYKNQTYWKNLDDFMQTIFKPRLHVQ